LGEALLNPSLEPGPSRAVTLSELGWQCINWSNHLTTPASFLQITFTIAHQMVILICVVDGGVLTCKPLALNFTNKFCCNKHSDGFNLADFFPGKFYTTESLIFIDQEVNAASSRPKYRLKKEREPLRAALYSW
jgi:hypothetical protein